MTMKIKGLCAAYGKNAATPVLHDITTNFEAGILTALIGPNGSGKSTLIKVIAGVLPAQSGTISGVAIGKNRAQTLAYLSQIRTAHPLMRVSDIVALGRAPHRKPFGRLTKDDNRAVESALQKTDLLALRDKTYATLSGGQQARVLLARALAVEAPILLVDEPAAALDPYYQLSILQVLKQEALSGKTVIAALHDLNLVRQFADDVKVMQSGRVQSEGTPSDVLSDSVLGEVFRIKKTGGEYQPV